MNRHLVVAALVLMAGIAGPAVAGQKYSSWSEISSAMRGILDDSSRLYATGDADGATERVNDAYTDYFEQLGFQRTVHSYISGRRAATVASHFTQVKQLMADGAEAGVVREELAVLTRMLRDDAIQLDGKEESATGVFLASLLVLVRAGCEPILVIAALAAFLVRSSNRKKNAFVYRSAVAAMVACALLAIALQHFGVSNTGQAILEGLTMLAAVVVLFSVGTWMLNRYGSGGCPCGGEDPAGQTVADGSAVALGLAAFLAVFQEGAETVIFYQNLFADTDTPESMVWLGLAVGSGILAVLFVLIRYGTLVIPARPFFLGTSILLFLLSVSFTGGGIKELQEAEVVGMTPVPWLQPVDLLGIYPTVETLVPQAVLLVLAVVAVHLVVRTARQFPREAAAPR